MASLSLTQRFLCPGTSMPTQSYLPSAPRAPYLAFFFPPPFLTTTSQAVCSVLNGAKDNLKKILVKTVNPP